MPFHLHPLSRRSLLGLLGASLGMPGVARAEGDPHRLALLSDTHIAADPATVRSGVTMAENLRKVLAEVLAARPGGIFLNGDCAVTSGLPADYETLVKLFEPARTAGMPLHFTLGNHDDRANFRAGLSAALPRKAVLESKQVSVVETPRANWFLLDSLDKVNVTPGKLGEDQLRWLGEALDARRDRPALVMLHHNPLFVIPGNTGGAQDTEALFQLLLPRRHVKAVFYGHIHHWNLQKKEDLHVVGLPPVAYIFRQGDPNGWVDCRLTPTGCSLELRALDTAHAAHGKPIELNWRAA